MAEAAQPYLDVNEPSAATAPPPGSPNRPEALLRDLRTALRALTPLGRREGAPERIGTAGLFYPLVGLAIGGVVAAVDWGIRGVVTQELTSVFLVAALAILSLGRHLDGFANTSDGLIGSRGREWALAIMRDRRLGTFGAAAIFFLLITKVRGFDLLSEGDRLAGLLLPPMLGRWAMVVLAHGSREASNAADGARYDAAVTARELAVASVITFAVVFALAEAIGLLTLIAVGAATFGLRLYFHQRLGGVNDLSVGAGAETAETLALLIFSLGAS